MKFVFSFMILLILSACVTRADVEEIKLLCRGGTRVHTEQIDQNALDQCMSNYNKLQGICLEHLERR